MANLDAPSGFRGVSTDPGPYACPDDIYTTADIR